MTDFDLEKKIREEFDGGHVPSPDLEERVLRAMPWHERPQLRRQRPALVPRVAGVFVAVIAFVLIVVISAPAILNRLGFAVPGGFGTGESPAYSLAAVSGNSVFVIQRQNGNLLLESTDNGLTWSSRLSFNGVYGGMQVFGDAGFVWSLDMGRPATCSSQSCSRPSEALSLYRTRDGGLTWTGLPITAFPVEDAYFVDATHGWADSSSPEMGLNAEVLYATTDGGTTWSIVGPLPHSSPMGYVYGVGNYRVTFSRNTDGSFRGWYVGRTVLYMSTDGGHAWSPVTLDAPPAVAAWTVTPQQPAFAGSNAVVAIGYRDPAGSDNATANLIYLYASSDGGATWGGARQAPAGFAPIGDVLSTSILDPRHVWLTSQSLTGGDNVQASPAVARTSDGGLTWEVVRNTPRILQMAFADPRHGFASDVTGSTNVNGILTTSDGGKTWKRITVPVFQS